MLLIMIPPLTHLPYLFPQVPVVLVLLWCRLCVGGCWEGIMSGGEEGGLH